MKCWKQVCPLVNYMLTIPRECKLNECKHFISKTDVSQVADTGERSEGCQVEPIVRRCASHPEQSGETEGQPAIRRCEGEREHPDIEAETIIGCVQAYLRDGSEPAPANPSFQGTPHETTKGD